MNASGRLNTCKSRGIRSVAIHLLATGARVRNAYATYLIQGDNLSKERLKSHSIIEGHPLLIKSSEV